MADVRTYQLAARRDSSVRPFSWPITEILNDALWETTEALNLRAVEGADAQTVRKLRSDASRVRSGGDR